MKNKVIIFSENKLYSNEILCSLVRRGLFDFSTSFCEDFDDCVLQVKNSRQAQCSVLVLCPNAFVDQLAEQMKNETDNLSLLFEQAIKLENGDFKMLFLPIELDYEAFLDEFFGRQKISCCTVFGKAFSFVNSKFKELNCSYKIITKNPFLHIIYYSETINSETLTSLFGDNLIDFSDESLASVCSSLLKEKNIEISIAEQISAGSVTNALASEGEFFPKRSFMLFSEKDFISVGIDADFLEENGIASKETAYHIARKLLIKADCDVILAVVGDNEGRLFVSVGNEEEIHVFSAVFEGNLHQKKELVCNFALFILQRFLKKLYD